MSKLSIRLPTTREDTIKVGDIRAVSCMSHHSRPHWKKIMEATGTSPWEWYYHNPRIQVAVLCEDDEPVGRCYLWGDKHKDKKAFDSVACFYFTEKGVAGYSKEWSALYNQYCKHKISLNAYAKATKKLVHPRDAFLKLLRNEFGSLKRDDVYKTTMSWELPAYKYGKKHLGPWIAFNNHNRDQKVSFDTKRKIFIIEKGSYTSRDDATIKNEYIFGVSMSGWIPSDFNHPEYNSKVHVL